MRKLTICVLTFWATSFAPIASADNMTGNGMLDACEAPDDSVMGGFCFGYVIGVIEGMKWGAALPFYLTAEGEATTAKTNEFADRLTRFCAPDSVTYGQYVDVFTKYLQQNPETRHESARTLAQDAFSQAFPCIK